MVPFWVMSAEPNEPLASYRHLLDPAGYAQLLTALERPLPPALRVNTLKMGVDQAAATWPGRYGWTVEPVPFCPAGWRITAGGDDLARTPEFKLGFYYLQEAASMLPAELFRLEPAAQHLTLDMAAAPGGKTTHLLSRMGDRGLVIANDSSAGRLAPLRANLQDWGAANIAVTNTLGELWGNWFPESFDRVLLDAPCSGQSLRTAERRKSRPVSERELEALQAQQLRLLVSGFQALRPGGEVVYATCSLHPAEDEAVLDALLARYPDAVEIAALEWVQAPALQSDGERTFRPAVGNALRLWPHLYDTSGFFAALIRKQASIPTTRLPHPARPLWDQGYAPLKPAERTELLDSLGQSFGFDLAAVLDAPCSGQRLALWGRRQAILAIPELYLERLDDLPAVSVGMLLAERKGAGLIPSHELVSRFGHQFTAGRLAISLAEGEQWLKGHELRGRALPAELQGSVVLVEDEWGRLLGRGKVLGGRLRNLLPRRLVY